MKTTDGLRVLVVDDELLIRWSIGETLRTDGYTVIEASDGATALRALMDLPPVDAILLDYRLPDSNDLTLLGTIRRLAPRTPVVLMTAYGTPELSMRAVRLGAFDVLHKPFDIFDVGCVLRRACERHEQSSVADKSAPPAKSSPIG